MATYLEVEKLRKKKHYVKYYNINKEIPEIDFEPKDINPIYTDEFNINRKESVDVRIREIKLIKEILEEHDCNGNNYQFRAMDMALTESNQPKYYSKYLKRLTTCNNNIDNDDTFENVASASATIDYPVLYTDLLFADKNSQEIWEIIKDLTLEVNSAALNGLFIKLIDVVKSVGQIKGDYRPRNKKAEKMIFDLYKKTMFGDRKNKPIEIYDDPSQSWQTIIRLSKHLRNVYNPNIHQELPENAIIEKIIKPFENIISQDFSLIDVNEYDI